MTRLPSLTARQVDRTLVNAGFRATRQTGSHRIYKHRVDVRRRVIVPHHGARGLKPGTLRSIIRQTGLSVDEFVALH